MVIMRLNYIFICCLISHVHSLIRTDELKVAKEVVEKIDKSFNNPDPKIFTDSYYGITNDMRTIVYDIALYNVPVQNLDYLDTLLNHSSENEKKFVDLQNLSNSLMEINDRFNFFETAISTNKYSENGTYRLEQISSLCSNFKPLFEDFNYTVGDSTLGGSAQTFLQWVSMRIQDLRSNQCSYQTQAPEIYLEFEMAFSFLSSNLKAFFINNLCSRYLMDSGSMIGNESHSYNNTYSKFNRIVNAALENYKVVRNYGSSAWSRRIENCDAPTFQRDINFIELERIVQLMILSDTKNREYCTNINDEVANSSCEGFISNCNYAPQIRYCTSQQGSRRFEWLQTFHRDIKSSEVFNNRSEVNFGNKNNCINEIKELSRPIDLHQGLKGEFCYCTCEETMYYSNKSTFIISSQWAESDFKKNFLITGVRFVKKNRIIYTQIMQGELKLGGRVGKSSWKEITPLNRSEINREMMKSYEMKSDKTKKEYIVINSRLRNINLNDIQCPSSDNYVLTGIKLGRSKYKHNANRIVLFIRCHKIVSPSWSIDESSVTEPIEDDRPHPNPLVIGGLPPNMVQQVHHPDSTETNYVGFKISDRRDAGQSVIPWFDAQNVTSPSGTIALSGVGIYHRGSESSGGFLAYRLIAVEYIRSIFPDIMKNHLVVRREKLDSSPAYYYCGHVLNDVMCVLRHSSYYPSKQYGNHLVMHNMHNNTEVAVQPTNGRTKRGIIDECCKKKCTTFVLKKYSTSTFSDDGLNIVDCSRKYEGFPMI